MSSDKARVQIYGVDWCPYCNNAKKLFSSLNVKFEYINTDENPQKKQELYKENKWSSIPMVFVDGQFKGGFSDVQSKLRSGELRFDEEEDD